MSEDNLGITQFLKDYPQMAIQPSPKAGLILSGQFFFTAHPNGGVSITDSYQLMIDVPTAFPKGIPKVFETGGKIPRLPDFHVNSDNSLCLGSPIRLLQKLSDNSDLAGFAGTCIVPYLYAVSNKLQIGEKFAFDELAHGIQGIIEDYRSLFNLQEVGQVMETLIVLAKRPREANKKRCPCGCGRRLGKCAFRSKINKIREIAPRCWFADHLAEIKKVNP